MVLLAVSDAHIVGALLILLTILMLIPMLTYREVEKPRVAFYQTGRNYMADLLTYVVTVAPPVDHDVTQRELVVSVDGEVTTTSVWPGSAVDLGAVTVPQGGSVVLTVVDIDDAGNRSAPAVVEFVAADTLPPSMPGGVSVTLVKETPAPVDVTPTEPEETA